MNGSRGTGHLPLRGSPSPSRHNIPPASRPCAFARSCGDISECPARIVTVASSGSPTSGAPAAALALDATDQHKQETNNRSDRLTRNQATSGVQAHCGSSNPAPRVRVHAFERRRRGRLILPRARLIMGELELLACAAVHSRLQEICSNFCSALSVIDVKQKRDQLLKQ